MQSIQLNLEKNVSNQSHACATQTLSLNLPTKQKTSQKKKEKKKKKGYRHLSIPLMQVATHPVAFSL